MPKSQNIPISTNQSKKNLFLEYLKEMNIEMLDTILLKSESYFDVSKETFLKKLNYIFCQYKLAGQKEDLQIKHFKESPKTHYLCSPLLCVANEFVIEENDGIMVKMSGTKKIKNQDELEKLHSLSIFFGNDEKIGFKPSENYLNNVNNCVEAFKEIVNYKSTILTSKDILIWLNKHKVLYADIQADFLMFKYNDFKILYINLQFIVEELKQISLIQEALLTYNRFDLEQLEKWIMKYYNLATIKGYQYETNFTAIDKKNRILKYTTHNLNLTGDDFFTVIEFDRLWESI